MSLSKLIVLFVLVAENACRAFNTVARIRSPSRLVSLYNNNNNGYESSEESLEVVSRRHILQSSIALLGVASSPAIAAPPFTARRETYEKLTAPEELTISLFERAAPSVVSVASFTSRFDPFATPEGSTITQPRGTGSGIVWDTSGHIVTNFHVIQNADDVQITFTESPTKEGRPGVQRVYPATLTGFDVDKDVAVLKVDVDAAGTKLVPLKVGKSQDLRVGQSVLALGNPFGLDLTLTTGIVSGLGREVRAPSGRPISDVVQTDASINPGNSGGPLLNSRGKVVGLNTAIYSTPAGASTGVRDSAIFFCRLQLSTSFSHCGALWRKFSFGVDTCSCIVDRWALPFQWTP